MNDQERFMYIMERVTEPLYQSPRGASNCFFNVPTEGLCEHKMKAATVQREKILTTIKPNEQRYIRVDKPKNMPDLKHFGSVCPRKGQFLYFLPSHRKLADELKQVFMAQSSTDDLYNMACACRDHPMINPQLFIQAMSACILGRDDMRKIRLPPFYEMMPDHFVETSIVQAAQDMARMPKEERMILELNSTSTGRNNNPENKLWYFREDIGANSHHFHWHIVFTGTTPKYPAKGSRHRRGELFYYMHHGMVARYDAERLSNGLPFVKPITLEAPIVTEGYFGKLYMTNSGNNWGTRQENTVLRDVDRTVAGDRTVVTLEELKIWRDRILEAIDTGYILSKDDKNQDVRKKLTSEEGIDVLGNMIENSQTLSPHLQFYGPFGLHNMGHVMIAFSHDPRYKFKEFANVMGDTSTALRDPAFYRWHKYIDIIFEKYKATLDPYNPVGGELPLKWDNIEVKMAQVVNSLQNSDVDVVPDVLSTYWMMSDIDLARGIDFGRTDASMLGPVWGRFTHLQYDHFKYRMEIENKKTSAVLATVRIFMAPRRDESGDRIFMAQQHGLYFEMDKFSKMLNPGKNSIERNSAESSITIPWERSFAQLEDEMRRHEVGKYPVQEGICGCGWPQHLLLPKGTTDGLEFDVVVFVTNGEDDKPNKGQGMSTGSAKEKCRQAMSYCGILNEMYPDSKPMGYPFDRRPFLVKEPNSDMQAPVTFIEKYAEKIPNMSTFVIRIVHQPDRKIIRTTEQGGWDGADQMETMNINGKCHPPKGNSNTGNGPIIFGQTSNAPKRNPSNPQYGWNVGNSNRGRQVQQPQRSRQGRRPQDDGSEDGYEMVGNDSGYRYE